MKKTTQIGNIKIWLRRKYEWTLMTNDLTTSWFHWEFYQKTIKTGILFNVIYQNLMKFLIMALKWFFSLNYVDLHWIIFEHMYIYKISLHKYIQRETAVLSDFVPAG